MDAQLTAAVIAWVVQQFAKGEGAVLCFLPVGGLGGLAGGRGPFLPYFRFFCHLFAFLLLFGGFLFLGFFVGFFLGLFFWGLGFRVFFLHFRRIRIEWGLGLGWC